MADRSPFITVVIAVLNGAGTIQQAIDSVAGQTYPAKELIVIDDGSTDATARILQFNRDRIAYTESDRNHGIAHAWNLGVGRARGDWIYFLGADDYLWDDGVLDRMAPILAAALPEHSVVYGEVNGVESGGRVLERYNGAWSRRAFLHSGMNLCHQGLFHHRSLFERHGSFDETFRVAMDYDLLLRELKSRDPFYAQGIVVAGMRHGGLSSDPAHTMATLAEFSRARRKNGVNGVPWGIHWKMLKARAKTLLYKGLGPDAAHAVADLYRLATGRPRKWTRV
ncbi:MAG: glycosyltransferase [Nitrospirae bacterium]|nr:glycosyltransferase [Nitrospirota bacterium]